MPRTFEPCKTVGVDVVYFPAVDPNYNIAVLNVVDWGTGYQALEPLDRMSSDHVWRKFHQCWVRIFGMPELIVMDQGRSRTWGFGQGDRCQGTVAARPHGEARRSCKRDVCESQRGDEPMWI